jgi:PPOX class probable F420-dependent enzyme
MPVTPADLGDEQYVLLTTYRRSGIGVPTPVWAARDGDALVVTTSNRTGKVKRLRRSSQVTVQACGVTGSPRRGSVPVPGRAEILVGRAAKAAAAPLRAKYGVQYRLGRAVERLFGERGHVVILRTTAP